MKSRGTKSSSVTIGLLLGLTFAGAGTGVGQEKAEYRAVGTFVEGCSCAVVCNCVFSGKFRHGCQGVGVVSLTAGSYKGVDLTGAKVAYGGIAGDRIYLYIDASDAQREAATKVAKGLFGVVGKVVAVRNAKIDLSGKDGRHTVSINGGTTAQLNTEPVLGGDKEAPISHVNTILPWTLMQARSVSGSFHESDLSFTLNDSNAFFNDDVDSKLTL